MNLFTPIPLLLKQTVIDGPNRYTLQTVTFCDQFNYLLDTEDPILTSDIQNGKFTVNINIIQDDDLPSNNCILPLVHQIELGALSDEEVLITINLTTENKQNPALGKKEKGSTTTTTVYAEEESRPIMEGQFS